MPAGLSPQEHPVVLSVVGLCLVLVLAVVGYRQLDKRRPKQRQRAAIKALLQECHGDQELCERLLFAELERAPQLDYTQAAVRARKRLMRDR